MQKTSLVGKQPPETSNPYLVNEPSRGIYNTLTVVPSEQTEKKLSSSDSIKENRTLSSREVEKQADIITGKTVSWQIVEHLKNGNGLKSLSIAECDELKKHYTNTYFYEKILSQLSDKYLKHCITYGSCSLNNISEERKTQEICDLSFKINHYTFIYIPVQFITLDQVSVILETGEEIQYFNKIPEIIIDNKEIQQLIIRTRNILAVRLPLELLQNSPSLVKNVCCLNHEAIKKFDDLNAGLITQDLFNEIYRLKAIEMRYVPTRFITKEILLKKLETIKTADYYIIDLVYSKYKEEIQDFAIKNHENYRHFKRYLPDDFVNEEELIELCVLSENNYRFLPEVVTSNPEFILKAIKKNHRILIDVSSKYITATIRDYIVNNQLFIYYKKIPEEYLQPEDLIITCLVANKIPSTPYTNIITDAWKNMLLEEYLRIGAFSIEIVEYYFANFSDNYEMFNKLLDDSLKHCAKYSCVVFDILSSKKIAIEFKEKLYSNLVVSNFNFKISTTDKLYCDDNPLDIVLPGYFLTELHSSCYQPIHTIQLPETAKTAKSFITEFIENNSILSKETITIPDNAMVMGGRTIQYNTSNNKAIFYKIRRQGEKLEDFAKEAAMLQFLQNTPDGNDTLKQLKSDIPVFIKIVSTPKCNLSNFIDKFNDSPHISTNDNLEEFVDVLIFSASEHYIYYAHKKDIENSDHPYARGNKGLLDACHDLGVMVRHGFIYTSTLPAYHNIKDKRAWTALALNFNHVTWRGIIYLGYKAIDCIPSAGKLSVWDTFATEKPDFGWTGLRDLGDFEYLGELQEIFNRRDLRNHKQFKPVSQYLATATAICEMLVAAILIYARLHKFSASYHYKNTSTHNKTMHFIEATFTSMLIGLTGDKTINLWDFMGITKTEADKWLDRAAFEILYWTAEQPKIDGNNLTLPFDIPDDANFNIHDCFSQHLIQNKKLPESLFDAHNTYDDGYEIEYPKTFTEKDGAANLGNQNATFPLLAYIKGAYLFTNKTIQLIQTIN